MIETGEKTPHSRLHVGDGRNIVGMSANKIFTGIRRSGPSDIATSVVELSTDNNVPGVLRIFGDSVRPGAHYKSVLATRGSTASELVKEALSRYNILEQKTCEYVLCEVIGKTSESSKGGSECRTKPPTGDSKRSDLDPQDWNSEYVRVIDGNDRPLLLQELWKPMDGYTRRFEIRSKDDVLKLAGQDKITTGINSNARKIQMGKVKPGVIPGDKGGDEQRKKNTLQLPRKESLSTNGRRCSSRTDSSSSVDSLSYGAYYPDRHSELPKAPSNCPFLLTLRGFDIRRDKLYYLIEDDVCVVGGLTQPIGRAPSVLLNAPDVLSQHCCLCRRRMQSSSKYEDSHQIVEIEPEPGAKVTVNGWAVYSRIVLASGDMITIGDHYVFLYKDLTAGQDIPMELPWLQDCGRTHSPQTSPVEFSSPEEDEKLFEFGEQSSSNLGSKDGDFYGQISSRLKLKVLNKWRFSDGSEDGSRPRFVYSKENEDDLIRSIVTLVDPFEDEYKLSPAYLYCMCIDYSKQAFGLGHTKKLISRILNYLRDIILKCSSALTEEGLGERQDRPTSEIRDDLHYARPIIFWMSNCLQIYAYVKHHVLNQNGSEGDSSVSGDVQKQQFEQNKVLSQFEEIVKFGFQQTVYSTTKVLYHFIPLMLDSNPFEEDKPCDVDICIVLQDIYHITVNLELDAHLREQIFAYLFFFVSASVFNKFMAKGSGCKYYNWHAGVRIAGNLQLLEDWSCQYELGEDYHVMFKEMINVVDLLATAKGKVMQMKWKSLRDLTPNLNPAQLHHILNEYQLGPGKDVPTGWLPDSEDMKEVLDSGSIQIKLSDHPPFTMPVDEACLIDLSQEITDTGLLGHFNLINTNFGISEDDDDSGYSVGNTPRLPTGRELNVPDSFLFKNNRSAGKLNSSPDSSKPRCAGLFGVKSGNLSQGRQANLNLDLGARGSISHSSQDGDVSEELDFAEIQLSFRDQKTSSKNQLNNFSKEKNGGILPSEETNGSKCPLIGHPGGGFGQVPNNKVKLWKTADWQESFGIDVSSADGGSVKSEINGLRVLSLEETGGLNSTSFEAGMSELEMDFILQESTQNEDVPPMTAMTTSYISDSSDDVVRLNLSRVNGGLGLGLIDGLHTSLRCPGLFVRTVVPGSPADKNRRIRIGDKVLAVNGTTLLGADYQTAMSLIRNAGENLQLVVARNDDATAMKLSSTTC